MLVVDLIALTQHLLLHGDLARAEPKSLRHRLLHVAARLTADNDGSGGRLAVVWTREASIPVERGVAHRGTTPSRVRLP